MVYDDYFFSTIITSLQLISINIIISITIFIIIMIIMTTIIIILFSYLPSTSTFSPFLFLLLIYTTGLSNQSSFLLFFSNNYVTILSSLWSFSKNLWMIFMRVNDSNFIYKKKRRKISCDKLKEVRWLVEIIIMIIMTTI